MIGKDFEVSRRDLIAVTSQQLRWLRWSGWDSKWKTFPKQAWSFTTGAPCSVQTLSCVMIYLCFLRRSALYPDTISEALLFSLDKSKVYALSNWHNSNEMGKFCIITNNGHSFVNCWYWITEIVNVVLFLQADLSNSSVITVFSSFFYGAISTRPWIFITLTQGLLNTLLRDTQKVQNIQNVSLYRTFINKVTLSLYLIN